MEKPNQHIQTLGRCWKGFELSNPGTDFVEGLVFLSFWKAKVRPFFWKSTMVASTKRTHESTSDISCCLFLRSKTETKQWRFYALSVCGCVSEASARDLGEFEQDPMILWNFFQVHTCQDIEHQLFVMNHLRSGCNCSGKILLEDHVFFSKCFLQSLHARLSSFPTNYPRSSSSGSLMVEQNGRLGSTVAGILAIFWSIPQMLWNHFSIFFTSFCHLWSFAMWWFQVFFFSPLHTGQMIQFDEPMFQMGWFNHQLVCDLAGVRWSWISFMANRGTRSWRKTRTKLQVFWENWLPRWHSSTRHFVLNWNMSNTSTWRLWTLLVLVIELLNSIFASNVDFFLVWWYLMA